MAEVAVRQRGDRHTRQQPIPGGRSGLAKFLVGDRRRRLGLQGASGLFDGDEGDADPHLERTPSADVACDGTASVVGERTVREHGSVPSPVIVAGQHILEGIHRSREEAAGSVAPLLGAFGDPALEPSGLRPGEAPDIAELVDDEADAGVGIGAAHAERGGVGGRRQLDAQALAQLCRVLVRPRPFRARRDPASSPGTTRCRVAEERHQLEHCAITDPRTRLMRELQGLESSPLRVVVHEGAIRPARVGGVGGWRDERESVGHGDRRDGVAAGESCTRVRTAAGVDAFHGCELGRCRHPLLDHELHEARATRGEVHGASRGSIGL